MIDFTDIKTIPQLWQAAVKQYGQRSVFKAKTLFNTRSFTYQQAQEYIVQCTHLLHAHKVSKGDRLLIVGVNSPAMALLMLTAYINGVVVVPADVRASADLLQKYAELVEPKLVVCSRWRERDVAKFVKPLILEELLMQAVKYQHKPRPTFPLIKPDDIAEIMFTSGTTGTPKGVMLTNHNIVSNVIDLQPVVPQMPYFNALSILPLSHIFEQVIGLFIPISVGGTIHYVRKANSVTLKQALQEWPITHLIVVPQVLKNLYRSIELEVEKQGRAALFERMLNLAPQLPMWARKLLFGQVHRKLGGNLRFIVSAGAKLDPHIGLLWENMGFPIMEGYGATEVSAAAAVNFINDRLIGSVGYPLKHVKVTIDPQTKEVLIKSPGVSPGYYKNKEKTAAAFTKDGWYRTGDIGELRDGRLYLLGRDAFKIVLSSGENVYVEDLESTINKHPAIWESCVVAVERDGREQIHAVIIPAQGKNEDDVVKAVKEINADLESHQNITSYSIWPESDFPRTITQKIDRKNVLAQLETTTANSNQDGTTDTVEDPVYRLITTLAPHFDKPLHDDLQLGNDVRLDSIDRVELIALAEDEFGVQIDDYKVTAETTIGQLRTMVEQKETHHDQGKLKQWPFAVWARLLRVVVLKGIGGPLQSLWIPLEVDNKQSLATIRGPAVVLFMHVGLFDLLLLYRQLSWRQLYQMATAATEDFWLNNFKLDEVIIELLAGGFPVSPDQKGGARAGLTRLGQALDRRHIVCIAPEGSISRTGKLQNFKRGAGLIASEMGVPVYLVAFAGEYQKVFPIGAEGAHLMKWHQYLPRWQRVRMTMRVSEQYFVADQAADVVTEFLHDEMEKLLTKGSAK